MESNENKNVTEEQALAAVNSTGTNNLEGIKKVGLSHFQEQLNLINMLIRNSDTTVTYEGFRKAFTLALTHEVMPEYMKFDLIPKQQFLAAQIAKTIDLLLNIKITEMSIKLRKDEVQELENNNQGVTNVATEETK